MRLTVGALFAGLAVGIVVGLASGEHERPDGKGDRAVVRRLEAAVTARARADARAGRIKGPVLRTECGPVERTPGVYSCTAVRFQTKLGYGGQTYAAKLRPDGTFDIRLFNIPIEWGV
jgi:hypothetical protein